MKEYLDLGRKILDEGHIKTDRTNTGTKSIFGYQMRFDLSKGFPLLTTKRVPFGLIKSELLWFLKGDTNIRFLLENKNHIWDEWAFKNYVESSDYQGPDMTDFGRRCLVDEEFNQIYQAQLSDFCQRILTDDVFAEKYGDLGKVYGYQWRHWQTSKGEVIDQIREVIEQIKHTPDSRRMIVSAWNVAELPKMALPPCHMLFQVYVADGKLSCQLYQRSCDIFLGVPFNIASYSLLTHMLAQQCDLEVGDFVWTGGDCHIYNNHFDQVRLQLSREPRPYPKLVIKRRPESIFDYRYEDFEIVGYDPHPHIKAPVAV